MKGCAGHVFDFAVADGLRAGGILAYERIVRAAPRPSQVEGCIGYGCMCGAVALLAVWLFFGNSSFVIRSASSLPLLLLFSWLLTGFAYGMSSLHAFWLALLLNVSTIFGAGVPLGLMRWGGVQLQRCEYGFSTRIRDRTTPSSQFSLAGLLVVIAWLAVLAAIVRWYVSLTFLPEIKSVISIVLRFHFALGGLAALAVAVGASVVLGYLAGL